MSAFELQRDGARATLWLNKPTCHNALGAADVQAIIEQLKQLVDDAALRVLVISGRGDKTFCAGAALEQLEDHSLRGDAFSGLAQAIIELPLPSVCLLNGSVYGGGVELALACDFRIGLRSSILQVPVARLGLSYSPFGLALYRGVLGPSLSKRILLSAEKIKADELKQLGFFDYLLPDWTAAQKTCDALCQRITALAPMAVQAMRQTLWDLSLNQYDSAIAQQREQQCFASADKKEGFAAALEKRAALFKNN